MDRLGRATLPNRCELKVLGRLILALPCCHTLRGTWRAECRGDIRWLTLDGNEIASSASSAIDRASTDDEEPGRGGLLTLCSACAVLRTRGGRRCAEVPKGPKGPYTCRVTFPVGLSPPFFVFHNHRRLACCWRVGRHGFCLGARWNHGQYGFGPGKKMDFGSL